MADYATLVFDIDASGADGAARALAGLNRYAAATATATAKLEKQARGANGQFLSYAETVARAEKEIRSLASAYNPALDAQLKFAEAQKEVARAVQLGVVSSAEQAVILRRLETEYGRAAQTGRGFFRVIGGGVGQVQNASYQVGDFFVQIASGQNAMMALSQQLPQLLGGFGAIGAAAGAAAAILGAAWMVWGSGAKSFAQSLSEAETAIQNMNSSAKILSEDGMSSLIEKYGVLDERVKALVQNQTLLQLAEASAAIQEALGGMASELGSGWFQSAYGELADVFKVSAYEADRLYGVISNIGNLNSIEEQESAIRGLKGQLSDATNNFTKMNEPQRRMLALLVAAEDQILQYNYKAEDAKRIMDRISETDMGNPFRKALTDIQAMTDKLIEMTSFLPAGLDATGNPIASGVSGMRPRSAPSGIGGVDWGFSDPKKGRGGGGDKRKGILSAIFGDLQTEQEKLTTWFEERSAQIAMFTDAELMALGGKHAAIERLELEHNQRLSAIDADGQNSRLGHIASFFGSMGDVAAAGGDRLAKAAATFGAIEATVNAYRAATQALADPTVPFWGKAAAYMSVLATGLGAVKAIKSAGSGGGGGTAGTTSASTSVARAEPERTTLIRIDGDRWAQDFLGGLMDEIYKQSKDGRVIIAGYN